MLMGMLPAGHQLSCLLHAVNAPGHYYVDEVILAVPCPADTYSPGRRYQRNCTPCPPGFYTAGVEGSTRISACSESIEIFRQFSCIASTTANTQAIDSRLRFQLLMQYVLISSQTSSIARPVYQNRRASKCSKPRLAISTCLTSNLHLLNVQKFFVPSQQQLL